MTEPDTTSAEEKADHGPGNPRRYEAFISYRHVEPDRSWAKWLHHALETYKTPAQLVAGGAPAKIHRIFRDEEELPASSSLSREIDDALLAADFLIVVCSPRTPESRWVAQEIKRFRELGRHDRIVALLIEGEPGESFPAPLKEIRRQLVDRETGRASEQIEHVEPLAADVRLSRPESPRYLKRMARLRIAAVLFGCRFDDLRQRHQERTNKRLVMFGASLAALAVVMALLTVFAFVQRSTAIDARAEAELRRTEAEIAREEAETRSFESRQRLSGLRVAEGWAQYDKRKPHLALPWFVQAMRDDPRPEPEKLEHRIRFAMMTRRVPSVQHVWAKREIPGVALSPDGRRVLSSAEGKVRVWDIATGRPATPEMDNGVIASADYSPDGRFIVTIFGDRLLARVWDAETGAAVTEPLRHDSTLMAWAMSPDRQHFVTADVAGSVRIWSVAGGTLAAPPIAAAKTQRPAISPDGSLLLLSFDEPEHARIWNLRTGGWHGPEFPVYGGLHAAAFNSDGSRLAVADRALIRIFQAATSEAETTIPLPFSFDQSTLLSFTPDGSRLLLVSDQMIGMWSAADLSPIGSYRFDSIAVPVKAYPVGPSGDVVIAGREQSVGFHGTGQVMTPVMEIRTPTFLQDLREVISPRILTTLDSHGVAMTWDIQTDLFGVHRFVDNVIAGEARLSGDGRRVYSLSVVEDAVLARDIESGEVVMKIGVPMIETPAIELSKDGSLLAIVVGQQVSLHRTETGEAVTSPLEHVSRVTLARFSPDGSSLLTADEGGDIRCYNPADGSLRWSLTQQGQVLAADFHPTEPIVATGSTDQTLVLRALATGQPVAEPILHNAPVMRVHYNPDGSRLFTSMMFQSMLRDGTTGEAIAGPLQHDFGYITAAAFSPTQKRVLLGGPRSARIYDTDTAKPLTPAMLLGAERRVTSVAYSADGRLVAAAGTGGGAMIWSAESGQRVSAPLEHMADEDMALLNTVRQARFTPDGKRLMTQRDEDIWFWDITVDDRPIEIIEAHAELLAGQTIDPTGSLSDYDKEHLLSTIERLGLLPEDDRPESGGELPDAR